MSTTLNTLSILQYNVWHSKDKVMAPLLADSKIQEFHVIAIQEPWQNRTAFTSLSGKDYGFHLAYRPEEGTRVAFYINKSIPKEDWEVEFTSRDLSTLKLRTKCPNQEQDQWIKIHNAYNPPHGNCAPQESVIPKLRMALDAESEHIVVGDFNLHHPLWAGPRQLDQHDEADDLIDASITNALDLLMPQGIKTWKTKRSAQMLDLAWASWTLSGFLES